MLKRMLIALILICSVSATIAFAEAEGQDEPSSGCNVANVAGTYGYVGFGTVLAGNPLGFPAGSYSSTGTLRFDGKGNLLIIDTERIDDVFFPPDTNYPATYTVDEQCVTTFTLTDVAKAGLPGPHFKGVFVNNHRGLRAISLLPGVIVNYVNTSRIKDKN